MKLNVSGPTMVVRRRTYATLGLAASAALLLSACSVGEPVERNEGQPAEAATKTLRLAHV